MASTFEKSVKGGTKSKLAAPKSKYVEHILIATHTGEAGVAEVFRTLQQRLRESTWTTVFKALILVHLMIREGEKDVALRYIAANPRKLAISDFTGDQLQGRAFHSQGRNIRNYTQFLLERARAYRDTKVDYVRSGENRLKKLSIDKGLLRETEAVQHQITALVRCDLFSDDMENEISLTAFRLLVIDLLALFYVMNEGVINILEHFFEMSKYDAERALAIYKTFSKQTNQVVEYLVIARQYEHATRLEVPKLKHAPTSLTTALEDYTQDPDFEVNRRQYMAQQELKKSREATAGSSKPLPNEKSKSKPSRDDADHASSPAKVATSMAAPAAAPPNSDAKGPDPDLIDFFESIEQNQQPMAQSLPRHSQALVGQVQQPYQFAMQMPVPEQQQQQQQNFISSYNPFTPLPSNIPRSNQPSFSQAPGQNLSPNMTGSGYEGYLSPPQSSVTTLASPLPNLSSNQTLSYQNTGFVTQQLGGHQPQLQPQSTNPFRQSMVATSQAASPTQQQSYGGGGSVAGGPGQRHSYNPFAKPYPIDTQQQQQQQQQSFDHFQPAIRFDTASSSHFQMTASPNQSFPPMTTNHLSMPTRTFSKNTNPFAHAGTSSSSTQSTQLQPQSQSISPVLQQSSPSVITQPTGSTNPFRQSMFQSTAVAGVAASLSSSSSNPSNPAWPASSSAQGTIGGLEHLPTVPFFARPAQPHGP